MALVLGGFWRQAYNLDHLSSTCQAMVDSLDNVVVLSVEYRRTGATFQGNYQTTTQDALDSVSFILKDKAHLAQKYGLDLSRVVIMGHSAGT